MTWAYFFKRVALFFVVVLTAMTANFIIAHSVPGDPIGAVISQMTTRGGAVENSAEIIASYPRSASASMSRCGSSISSMSATRCASTSAPRSSTSRRA